MMMPTDSPAAGWVHQIEMPPEARTLSTLAHIDYEDAFLLDTGPTNDRTAEQWARAVLCDAPVTVRGRLQSGWTAIGLKLSRDRADRAVLGWVPRRCTPDHILLGAASRIGMPGELLFKREPDALLFATFVQQDNPIARALWTRVEATHVPVVRSILEDAGRRCRA